MTQIGLMTYLGQTTCEENVTQHAQKSILGYFAKYPNILC